MQPQTSQQTHFPLLLAAAPLKHRANGGQTVFPGSTFSAAFSGGPIEAVRIHAIVYCASNDFPLLLAAAPLKLTPRWREKLQSFNFPLLLAAAPLKPHPVACMFALGPDFPLLLAAAPLKRAEESNVRRIRMAFSAAFSGGPIEAQGCKRNSI